ncbi:IclR family transcriptional regulator [Comamonas aquatica]|uniref:IclR family transcriptional regulator n=1 Tax=Comamonas aquatica TaxID=225991 RepID=UPI0009F68F09|nr:helix-turn-helix domain-containing protein [Comamonas aquatica]
MAKSSRPPNLTAVVSARSTSKSPADIDHVPGREHVHAVVRAISLLKAFDGGDEVFLSLTELARRTGMHKPTALRLARTLELSRFLVQREDAAWRLGPAAGWLGSRYQAQFDVGSVIEPILVRLAAETGESASFYVHEGNLRSCLMRCDGPNARPDHPRSGELLPLELGAPGRAILAALGEPGDLYERIRRKGFHWARAERSSGAAAVAAAVRGSQGTVLGAVSTSGPVERLTPAVLRKLAPVTIAAARQLGLALGGVPATSLRATWHP